MIWNRVRLHGKPLLGSGLTGHRGVFKPSTGAKGVQPNLEDRDPYPVTYPRDLARGPVLREASQRAGRTAK